MLDITCAKGHTEIAKLLLKDPTSTFTCFTLSMYHVSRKGFADLLELFLKDGRNFQVHANGKQIKS